MYMLLVVHVHVHFHVHYMYIVLFVYCCLLGASSVARDQPVDPRDAVGACGDGFL